MENPTLIVEGGTLGFDEDWGLCGFAGRALLGLERKMLTALVFECLEAVRLSVWMSCRDGRKDLPRQLLDDLREIHIAKRTLPKDLSLD